MLNYATQRHLSHVLLIDSESAGTMLTLAENALDLRAEFGTVSGVSPYGRYTLILAFPANRADLAKVASDLKQRSDRAGARCVINAVQDADMFLIKGKAGLLSCSLYTLAGAVLVNDSPIPRGSAAAILSAANKAQGIHPIGGTLNAAVISNQRTLTKDCCGYQLGTALETSSVLWAWAFHQRHLPDARDSRWF